MDHREFDTGRGITSICPCEESPHIDDPECLCDCHSTSLEDVIAVPRQYDQLIDKQLNLEAITAHLVPAPFYAGYPVSWNQDKFNHGIQSGFEAPIDTHQAWQPLTTAWKELIQQRREEK